MIQLHLSSYNQKLFNIEAKILVATDRQFEKVKPNVEAALYEAFSFSSRQFGQPVSLSEITAVIQKIDGVVATNVDALYLFDPSLLVDPSRPLLTWKNVTMHDLRDEKTYLDFLARNLEINWTTKWQEQTNHKPERSIDGNRVTIAFENNSVSAALNDEKNRITFKIVDTLSVEYRFIVKREGETENLNIYPMRLVNSIPCEPAHTNSDDAEDPTLAEILILNPKGVTLMEMAV